MKKLIPAILLLFSVQSNAQVPDYFGNNPSWYCGFNCSGTEGCPSQSPCASNEGFHDEILYYLGDTVELNGHSYYPILHKTYRYCDYTPGPWESAIFEDSTGHFVRQEGRAIYYWTGTSDSLLISYDLNVGDSIVGKIGALSWYPIVEGIDSVLVGSSYRKIIYIYNSTGSPIIEGIGHLDYTSESFGSFFAHDLEYGAGLGFSYSLYCYGENNISLWSSTTSEPCKLNLGTTDLDQNLITIHPNPTTDIIQIENAPKGTLKIYSIHGQMILDSHDIPEKINFYTWENGVYLIDLQDENGNHYQVKVIKL